MNRAISVSVSLQTDKQISGAGADEGTKVSEIKGAKGETENHKNAQQNQSTFSMTPHGNVFVTYEIKLASNVHKEFKPKQNKNSSFNVK